MSELPMAGPGDMPFIPATRQISLVEFDPDEFMHFIESENLSVDEARALLVQIWHITVAFAQLGFGHTSIQQALDKSSATATPESGAVVKCGQQFSVASGTKASMAPEGDERRRRDS
jgi:hypothetical protein